MREGVGREGAGLEVAGLSVQYGQHCAVDDVALTVAAGEIVVILGANGSGKSSLLKAVAGLHPAGASARVTLSGRELAGLPAHAIVEAGLALVPEGRGIFGEYRNPWRSFCSSRGGTRPSGDGCEDPLERNGAWRICEESFTSPENR